MFRELRALVLNIQHANQDQNTLIFTYVPDIDICSHEEPADFHR